MNIHRFGWSGNGHLITAVSMPDSWRGQKIRRSRLTVVDLAKEQNKLLEMRDGVVSYLPRDPKHILLNILAYPAGSRLVRLNLRSEQKKLYASKERFVYRWRLDSNDSPRVAYGTRHERYGFKGRASGDERFEEISRFHIFEENGIRFAGYHEDPNRLYVYSDEQSGRRAVYEFNLKGKTLGKLIFGHPDVDVSGLRYQPGTDRLVSVGYITDRTHFHFVDPEAEKSHNTIKRALGGAAFSNRKGDLEWKNTIVTASSDTMAPKLYVFDRAAKRLHYLVSTHPHLDDKPLAPMKSVTYTARDGKQIPAFLTLPLGREPADLPAILFVHGGPSSRDVWRFNPRVQFLANRGFAVLQPNFRGSTGYGVEFHRAGWKQWGLAMQDDVTDGAKWLIDEGIADPSRIGIYGVSYGGYVSLIGAAVTPDLYAAAASFAAPTDLIQLLEDDAVSGWEEYNRPTIGGSWSDRKMLKQVSPTARARDIKIPILLAHGELDPRVHQRHAKRMRKALRKAKVDHEYYLYEDEVHGFLNEDNQIDFYKKLGAFFEKHLGASEGP